MQHLFDSKSITEWSSTVTRQKRLTISGDHFYIELVLYNRLLKCFVLIDFKLGKLTYEDIRQMILYTTYYTREMLEEWENPTMGILLSASIKRCGCRIHLSC